jgi:predicted ribosome quality control (RQC) complex YloA/Tae2 family protein
MVNFREFITSSGKHVLAGKDAQSNERLVEQAGTEETVLHTKAPGSPFANIKLKEKEKTSKKDIRESAVFCARYSQDWRDNKRDVIVHYFKGKDIYKEKEMKLGTFGVKNTKEIKVKKEEIEKFEESNKK